MAVTNDQTGTQTGTGSLIQCGLGTTLSILSNSISVDNSVHFVSGSGTLTTVNWAAANSVTNPSLLILIPSSGSTWSLGWGGNIVPMLHSVVADRPIILVWDGASKWREVPTLPAAPSVTDYGAKADGRIVGVNCSSGIAQFTITSGTTLTSADIGRSFAIPGAGGTGTALTGTITSIISTTIAGLSTTPTASVTGASAAIATDDTVAIQAAIDANLCVRLPAASCGFTKLRLRYGSAILGSGFAGSMLLAIGGTENFITMKSATLAQGLLLKDFEVRCFQVGTALDCFNLGNEVGSGFALGSLIENIGVWDATGLGFDLAFNAATVRNIWVEQTSHSVQSTAGGFKAASTNAYVDLVSVEGNYPAGPVILNAAGASDVRRIQLELSGTNSSTDAISIGGTGNTITNVYFYGTGTVRDVIRIATSQQFTEIRDVHLDPTRPTFANTINDIPNSRTIVRNHVSRYLCASDGMIDVRVLPVFATNAAAVSGGLPVGSEYQTSTGELRIVV